MFGELWWAVSDWVRRIPRGWRYAGIAILVALLVIAVAGIGGGSSATGEAAVSATATRGAGAPPQGAVMLRRDGNAVLGVMHSDDGAAAAALSYTGQRNALQTGGTSSAVAAEVGAKLALGGHDIGKNPASIPDHAADQNAQAMLATRQGTLIWRTLPIAYRVQSYTSSRATVRVYSAALSVYSATQGSAAMGFSLRDMKLRWQGGAWRIDRVTDTPDQPTPALIASTNSNAQASRLPIRDRLLAAEGRDASGLYRWLNGAAPIVAGPTGMGPVAGNRPTPADENFVAELQRGYAESARATADRTGQTWSAGTPIAYRPIACPTSVQDDETRCYELLLAATQVRGRGIALTALSLDGIAVSAKAGAQGSVRFDLTEQRQQDVLGGVVNVASAGLPDRRTTNQAWRRSILPLTPAIPGGAR